MYEENSSQSDDQTNQWDADDYDSKVGFVAEYGESVVNLLDPTPGERVLDLGCGTGSLTAEIANTVGSDGTVIGIDSAPDMVASARDTHPELIFHRTDARELSIDEFDVDGFDAVFSNAALHWIPQESQATVARRVANVLTQGGRFVAELGGVGNVETIVEAVRTELRERGYKTDHPWYFPTVGAHSTVLENEGFEVQFVRLFDRPTDLDGVSGLRDWLSVFGDSMFATLDDQETEDVVTAVEDRLRKELYDPDTNTWSADYRRLRFVAKRL